MSVLGITTTYMGLKLQLTTLEVGVLSDKDCAGIDATALKRRENSVV